MSASNTYAVNAAYSPRNSAPSQRAMAIPVKATGNRAIAVATMSGMSSATTASATGTPSSATNAAAITQDGGDVENLAADDVADRQVALTASDRVGPR